MDYPCYLNLLILTCRYTMSWLFGMNQRPQDFSQFVPPPGASGGDGGPDGPNDRGKGNSSMEAYRFDSAALERAAKAAKDLEKSGMYSYGKIVYTGQITSSTRKDC